MGASIVWHENRGETCEAVLTLEMPFEQLNLAVILAREKKHFFYFQLWEKKTFFN